MSLLTGLISHWSMDEASGTRADSHGTNHLTDNNTVLSAAGKIGNAAEFTVANSESLSVAHNPSLVLGDADFTIALWARPTAADAFQMVVVKGASSGDADFELRRVGASDEIEIFIDAGVGHVASTGSAFPAGAWAFVVFWHDKTANTVNLQVNNGTVFSASHSHSGFVGTELLSFGVRGVANYFGGLEDEGSLWGRVLTADERTALYNGGAGLAYAAFAPNHPVVPLMRAFGSGVGL